MLDSGAVGPWFKSLSGNSLRQTVHTHRASVHQAAKLVAALLSRVYDYVTCRLTAKNWDQLQNPTLGNRVWAIFTLSLVFMFTEVQEWNVVGNIIS